jgi:hypothetical protein
MRPPELIARSGAWGAPVWIGVEAGHLLNLSMPLIF